MGVCVCLYLSLLLNISGTKYLFSSSIFSKLRFICLVHGKHSFILVFFKIETIIIDDFFIQYLATNFTDNYSNKKINQLLT